MLSLIDSLQQDGYKIVFASPAQPSDHGVDLSNLNVEQYPIELNASSFDEWIVRLDPALVLFDRFMMEEQFGWRVAKYCPDAIRILDTEDLHCLRNARHLAHKQNRMMTDTDLKSDMALREIAAILRCDLSLIISSFEKTLLTETFGVSDKVLQYCPFMLKPAQSTDDYEKRQHFVSIGNFRHAPNWDAVLWLNQDIWPQIRAALPKAELHVYGAYPPPKATALHAPKKGFYVDGWTKNLEMVLAQSRVCLAPLRFGAGLKGKLADAMRLGTPSVTTSIGAEGMHGTLPWPGEVSDDPQHFAELAINLYQNKTRWLDRHSRIRPILDGHFDADRIRRSLLERIHQVKNDLPAHRLDNFMGMMLNHHQHKSTQYMAQWIEAKNKL